MRRKACRRPVHALMFTGLIASIVLFGCGDEGDTKPDGLSAGSVEFLREDSSVVEFPESTVTYVWCGDWEPGSVPVPALHVWAGAPGPGQRYWWLRAVITDVELDVPLSFPNHFIWDEPDGVSIFLFDPPNELATDAEDSGGTITFHTLPCPGSGALDFSIEAVLGSEYGDMSAVTARGRFTCRVTGPPPWEVPEVEGRSRSGS